MDRRHGRRRSRARTPARSPAPRSPRPARGLLSGNGSWERQRAAPMNLAVGLPAVTLERDDLLDAARPVRVPDGGRQQARSELDPLRVGVHEPAGDVAALRGGDLVAGLLEGLPDRRLAARLVARTA